MIDIKIPCPKCKSDDTHVFIEQRVGNNDPILISFCTACGNQFETVKKLVVAERMVSE